jgi:hypothetical protein
MCIIEYARRNDGCGCCPHLSYMKGGYPGLYERRAIVMSYYEYLTVITIIAIILYIIKK